MPLFAKSKSPAEVVIARSPPSRRSRRDEDSGPRAPHPADRRRLPGGHPAPPHRRAVHGVLVPEAHRLGHEGRGVQGSAVPIRGRLPHPAHARADPRSPGRLPGPTGRHAAGGYGPGPQGGRAAQGRVCQDRVRPDHVDGRAVHRRHRRHVGPAHAGEALVEGNRLLGRPARRGVRQQRRGGGLPAKVSRPGDDPAPAHRQLVPPTSAWKPITSGRSPARTSRSRSAPCSARTDPVDFEGSIAGLADALRPVLEAGRERNVLINFDMEIFRAQGPDPRAVHAVLRGRSSFPAGLAMQAYLRSGDDDARQHHRLGQAHRDAWSPCAWSRAPTGTSRRSMRSRMGWPVPVWSRKPHTDASFERMAAEDSSTQCPRDLRRRGASSSPSARTTCARSRRRWPGWRRSATCRPRRSSSSSCTAWPTTSRRRPVDRGLRVREYVPVGEMIPGMAYLVRRLLENTSNESWLLARPPWGTTSTPERFSQSPHRRFDDDPGVDRIASAPERHQLSAAVPGVGDERPFFTEPSRDFADPIAAGGLRRRQSPSRCSPRRQRRHRGPRRGPRGAAIGARSRLPGPGATPIPARGPPSLVAAAAIMRGSGATSSRASRFARRARPGARPTRTSARRSTSASTTRRVAVDLFEPRPPRRVHRRARPGLLPAARRGRDRQPLELPAGDLLRHDHRRPGDRQRDARQAVPADPGIARIPCARFSGRPAARDACST